jgi:hypothetical protein
LESIDKEAQNRIAMKLKEYAKEPLGYARELAHPKIGTHRFNISSLHNHYQKMQKKGLGLVLIGF